MIIPHRAWNFHEGLNRAFSGILSLSFLKPSLITCKCAGCYSVLLNRMSSSDAIGASPKLSEAALRMRMDSGGQRQNIIFRKTND